MAKKKSTAGSAKKSKFTVSKLKSSTTSGSFRLEESFPYQLISLLNHLGLLSDLSLVTYSKVKVLRWIFLHLN